MRNMKRKLFALLLTICLFLSGLPHYEVFADTTEQEEEETPEIVKVDLGITDFALAVGHEKEIIIPDYEYEGAILEKRVKWTFSKGAKAKLELTEEGKIRALGKGKVSLKVKVDYYKDETLIAQGSKFFYVYATRPNISVTDYSYNMYEKKTVNIPLEGCYSLSKVEFKSSSKKLNVKQKGLSLDVTPSKAGKYSVDVTVDEVEFKLNFEVYNLYFKKAPNTIADASSKNWVNGRSMICMKKNDRASLEAYGFDKDSKLKWTSSNPKAVYVSQTGKIRAKAIGQSVITVTGKVNGNPMSITYAVGVANSLELKAIRYGYKHWQSTYSQAKRMKANYYDCSSFVWRSYMNAGFNIGNVKNNYAPCAAAEALWCVQNNYMLYSGSVEVSKLLPGDIIFWTGSKNGRYKGIYHVDLYIGNNTKLTVPRERYLGATISNCMVARISGVKPTSFKAAKGNIDGKSGVKLTWKGVYGASGYQIVRCNRKTGKYTTIAKVKDTNYFDLKCKKNNTYAYKVRPYFKNGGKSYYGKYSQAINVKY